MTSILYIDPGSGSMLIQAIIAAVVGGLFIVKGYWYKIKSFFSGKKYDATKSKKNEDEIEY